jgi:ABC-type multidrug transport system ATPase subunit
VTSSAIYVDSIEKLFPPAQTGWRAFTSPFARPTHRALAPISFRVAPGESLAIVGANGAGKSTLLRILTTLLLPTTGRAEVAGWDVVRQPESVRHALGFHSGAEPGFYARLTVLQNLQFFAELRDLTPQEIRRRIAEVSDGLGLAPSLGRQVRLLSSGTVQRLSLARAVLHRPRVLLLDEPTRSLDPLAAAEFRRFLREDLIRRHGATLLFASHTLAEVEELADRVALLDSGRLLFCGTPAEMRAAGSAATLEEAMVRLAHSATRETGAHPQ